MQSPDLAAWMLGPHDPLRPQKKRGPCDPGRLIEIILSKDEMRNGELECMRRSPDMRCSLQEAIERKNNWVVGAQS